MTAPDLPGAIPGPFDRDAPQFHEPWQARAFALTLALHDAGAFAWTDWAAALGARIGAATPLPTRATPAEHARDYWLGWLAALESLLAERGLAEAATVRAMAETWQRAALATPHGVPIRYEAGLDPS